jgi:hypothetical protein
MSHDKPVFGGAPIPDPHPGRRQLDELTGVELRAQPAWWFPGPGRHLTGPDAATVMPIDACAAAADGSVEFPDGKYLLHATFTLADGSTLDGHVTFVGGGVPGDDGSLAAHLTALGRPRAAVFPLCWRATLHPPGVDVAGELQGFAVLRDGAVRFV